MPEQSPEELKMILEIAERVNVESRQNVDRSLIRENLKLTPDQRIRKMVAFTQFANELREAGKRSRSET